MKCRAMDELKDWIKTATRRKYFNPYETRHYEQQRTDSTTRSTAEEILATARDISC